MMSTEGDAEVKAMIQSLMDLHDKKVGSPAIRAGLNVIAGAYRGAANDSARTRRHRRNKRKGYSIGAKTSLKQSTGTRITRRETKRHSVGGKAGFNVSKKARSRRAPHAHLVTLGTKMRRHKSGKNTGRVRPDPRFGNAARATFPRAVARMREKALERIQKLAKK